MTVYKNNGEAVEIFVQVRPFALKCLQEASNMFEVIIFTASTKSYADAVINLLDPDGKLIDYRLYQDDCIPTPEEAYLKDLRILNRNLEDVIIVDNSVWSFANQLENGVQILPWTGNPDDRELCNLIIYLKEVRNAIDVREVNRSVFKLQYLIKNDIIF